jgi:hypothetical protein
MTLGRVLQSFKFSDLYGSDTSDSGFEDCDIVQSCEVDTNILHALVSSFSELLQPSRCRQEECRATNVQVFRDATSMGEYSHSPTYDQNFLKKISIQTVIKTLLKFHFELHFHISLKKLCSYYSAMGRLFI